MFNLVDADRHVTEPLNVWPDYVDRKVYESFPVVLKESKHIFDGNEFEFSQAFINGYPILKNWSPEIQHAVTLLKNNGKKERYDSMHPVSQLRSMDENKVRMAYLFPAFTMGIVNHSEIPPEVSIAYADAYNRWLKDYVSVSPSRLRAVGVISRHQPSEMVTQLEKIMSYGWSSVTIRPEPINGRVVGDYDYHAFYKACADNNIAIVFHGGTHLYGESVGSDRFKSRLGLHACAHPIELQMAFTSLLESGVLDRNPSLKIGLVEGGCSWVPHWLWRLDHICYPEFPSLVKDNIKMLPSDYFRRHCWVDFEVGEPCIREFVETVGHEKLIFGTDFPHPDHLDFDFNDVADEKTGLTTSQLRDVFEKNALDLFERSY